jgi:hypothetical protein
MMLLLMTKYDSYHFNTERLLMESSIGQVLIPMPVGKNGLVCSWKK